MRDFFCASVAFNALARLAAVRPRGDLTVKEGGKIGVIHFFCTIEGYDRPVISPLGLTLHFVTLCPVPSRAFLHLRFA